MGTGTIARNKNRSQIKKALGTNVVGGGGGGEKGVALPVTDEEQRGLEERDGRAKLTGVEGGRAGGQPLETLIS